MSGEPQRVASPGVLANARQATRGEPWRADCMVLVSCAHRHELLRFPLDRQTGLLAEASTRIMLPGPPPSHQSIPLAVASGQRRLYAATRSAPYVLATYRLDASGAAALIGTASLACSLVYIAVDATNRCLVGVSYPQSCVLVFRLDGQGLPEPSPSCVLHDIAHAHSVALSKANDVVYVAELGRDRVVAFELDAGAGQLSPDPVATAQLRAASGPRHLALDAEGARLYCLNETDASIDVLEVADDGRALRSRQTAWLPSIDTSVRNQRAADLRLAPDGRRLYATERDRSTLATFAVEFDGSIEPIDLVDTEPGPRAFAVDPAGTCLIVAGQVSGRVAVHAIDAATGIPGAARSHPAAPGASWVEIVETDV